MLRKLLPLLGILAVLGFGGTTFGQRVEQFGQRPKELDAAQIRAGLKVARIEEQGFVDRVMINVARGKVPRSLVESTFDWARRKPAKTKFQYFKRGLALRAQKAGIDGVDVVAPTQ